MFEKYQIFQQFQKPILSIANNSFGRKYLGIDKEVKEKIVYITPNSYVIQIGKNKYKQVFRCYDLFAKKLEKGIKLGATLGMVSFIPHVAPLVPFFALTNETYYAAAGDGATLWAGTNATAWSTIRSSASANTLAYLTDAEMAVHNSAPATERYLGRAFFPTDTSAIPDTATISSASQNFYVTTVDSTSTFNIVLCQMTAASTSTLTQNDFNTYDSLDSPSEWSARIAITTPSTSAYYAFAMNATGLAAISKTGFTRLGMRGHKDIDNVTPTNGQDGRISFYSSKQTGTSQDPYLEVVYSIGGGSFLLQML